jgi:hypothetical protein
MVVHVYFGGRRWSTSTCYNYIGETNSRDLLYNRVTIVNGNYSILENTEGVGIMCSLNKMVTM